MINAWSEPIDFSVPEPLRGSAWRVEVDTADPGTAGRAVAVGARAGVQPDAPQPASGKTPDWDIHLTGARQFRATTPSR